MVLILQRPLGDTCSYCTISREVAEEGSLGGVGVVEHWPTLSSPSGFLTKELCLCVFWVSVSSTLRRSDKTKSMELSCHDSSRSLEEELPLPRKAGRNHPGWCKARLGNELSCSLCCCEFRVGKAPITARSGLGWECHKRTIHQLETLCQYSQHTVS